MTVRVRFAPSPTGKLHVGNVRTALLNLLYARKHGGRFLLRFEDTDLERDVPGAEQRMIDILAWLGMTPDESPYHGGDYGPYRTREREARGDYQQALKTLEAKGLVYECFVSKDELDVIRRLRQQRGLPPAYDNRHRDLTEAQKAQFKAEGRTPVIRFKLLDGPIVFHDEVRGEVRYEAENLGGDPVIVRSNGIPTFAFANVVDDINQKITQVIRGEDHVTNTALQVRLYEALGHKPSALAHVPMMLDNEGGKLSKRLDSLSIESLREQGYLPKAITSYLAAVGSSMDPAPGSIEDLAARFEFSAVGRAPMRFDLAHVGRLNALVLREMNWADLWPHLEPFMQAVKLKSPAELETFWHAVRGNVTLLPDVRTQYDLCFGEPEGAALEAEDRDYIKVAEETLPQGPYTTDTWQSWVGDLKTRTGRKGKALFMPLRLALTGAAHGPELADLLPLIGEDRARARLRRAAH